MATADPRGALGAVVDAIAGLGYRSARIYVTREKGTKWEVVLPGGVSDELAEEPHALTAIALHPTLSEGRPLILRRGDRGSEARQVLDESEKIPDGEIRHTQDRIEGESQFQSAG